MEGGSGGGVKLYSHNLRDFLRMKEEDHRNMNQRTSSNGDGDRRDSSGLTLLALLTEKRAPPPPADNSRRSIHSSRTLLDIIRDEQISRQGSARTDWQQLRDKIRLRHSGAGSSLPSSVPIPMDNHNRLAAIMTRSGESTHPSISLTQINPNQEIERASRRFEPISLTPRERNPSASAATEVAPEQPARTSLMSLLAENDRQVGINRSACLPCAYESVDIGCSSSTAAGADSANNNCCVCMVREKGAAFIPCGHTFCRVCSRELWVQRGNCPLCNNSIIEILDIF